MMKSRRFTRSLALASLAGRTLLKITLVARVAMAAPALGDDDCPLDADAIVAPLVKKLPKGHRLLSNKSEDRLITQKVKLPEGKVVTVSLGGCAHLTFAVSLPGTRHSNEELITVLDLLPLKPMPKGLAKTLGDALSNAKPSALPIDLPCGDNICRLEIVAGDTVISYDFML